jgi:DNA-binding NarL/FixJ family response regulator
MSALEVLLLSSDPLLRSALAVAAEADPALRLAVAPIGPEDGVGAGACPAGSVVVLDVENLPGDAAEWCAKAAVDGRRVLVLHAEPDVRTLVSCLEAGASGFQTKDLDLEGFCSAVNAVSDGEAVIPRQMLGGLLRDLIDKRRRDDERFQRFNLLTRREREILGLLGEGQDQDDIAQTLVISPQTARTHIQNILTKLEVHSRMEAVSFAHELDAAG